MGESGGYPDHVHTRFELLQILIKEFGNLLERDHIHFVVKIRMIGARDNHQFLVVREQALFHTLVRSFREISRMSIFTMNEQDRSPQLIDIGFKRHVYKSGLRSDIPSVVGTGASFCVTDWRPVEMRIVLYKLRSVIRNMFRIDDCGCIVAVLIIFCSLFCQFFPFGMAVFFIVAFVKVAVGLQTGHVIHCAGYYCFDSGIKSGSI